MFPPQGTVKRVAVQGVRVAVHRGIVTSEHLARDHSFGGSDALRRYRHFWRQVSEAPGPGIAATAVHGAAIFSRTRPEVSSPRWRNRRLGA
jgi:hypothetical protein